MTARLYGAGIPLVTGTDDIQGLMLDRGVELWVQAGIPPEQVLRITTIGAARVARPAQERGSITPGKFADVAFVWAVDSVMPHVARGRPENSRSGCHVAIFPGLGGRAAAMYSSAVEEGAGLEIAGARGAADVTTWRGATFQNRKRVTTAVMPMKAPAITAKGLSNHVP